MWRFVVGVFLALVGVSSPVGANLICSTARSENNKFDCSDPRISTRLTIEYKGSTCTPNLSDPFQCFPQGRGRAFFPPEDLRREYEGEFEDGFFSGTGVLKFRDGSVHSGSFQNDRLHGEGIIEDSSGATHSGGFKHGLRHGAGSFRGGGVSHAGTFVNNLPSGDHFEIEDTRGKYYGKMVRGHEIFGCRHNLANHLLYCGNFGPGGKPHGRGMLFGASGIIEFDGTWRDGKPSQMHAHARGEVCVQCERLDISEYQSYFQPTIAHSTVVATFTLIGLAVGTIAAVVAWRGKVTEEATVDIAPHLILSAPTLFEDIAIAVMGQNAQQECEAKTDPSPSFPLNSASGHPDDTETKAAAQASRESVRRGDPSLEQQSDSMLTYLSEKSLDIEDRKSAVSALHASLHNEDAEKRQLDEYSNDDTDDNGKSEVADDGASFAVGPSSDAALIFDDDNNVKQSRALASDRADLFERRGVSEDNFAGGRSISLQDEAQESPRVSEPTPFELALLEEKQKASAIQLEIFQAAQEQKQRDREEEQNQRERDRRERQRRTKIEEEKLRVAQEREHNLWWSHIYGLLAATVVLAAVSTVADKCEFPANIIASATSWWLDIPFVEGVVDQVTDWLSQLNAVAMGFSGLIGGGILSVLFLSGKLPSPSPTTVAGTLCVLFAMPAFSKSYMIAIMTVSLEGIAFVVNQFLSAMRDNDRRRFYRIFAGAVLVLGAWFVGQHCSAGIFENVGGSQFEDHSRYLLKVFKKACTHNLPPKWEDEIQDGIVIDF